jgi:putative DNA primase/helicase
MSCAKHTGDYALDYIRRGWNPLPLPYKTKTPLDMGWHKRVIREEDVPKHFNGDLQNIGVILGATSGGLTDIDLDCREAVDLASYVLPKTGAMFGRASNRASHRLYRTDLHDAVYGAEVKFQDPTRPSAKRTILEVRIGGKNADGEIKGAQTVFPGSVHESGEEITWEEAGEPAEVDGTDLVRAAKLLASCCLFARYWPGQGARHDAALALGGFLARSGLQPTQIKYLVEAIAKSAGDPESRDRRAAAEDAARACLEGKHAYGFPFLKNMFGDALTKQVAEWLGYNGQAEEGRRFDVASPPSSKGLPNDIVTEDSAAQRFVELHGQDLRFCHSTGSWYRWNGVYWSKDQTGIAFHWARELARKLAADQDARKRYITNKTSFAAGVERFAKVDRTIAVTVDYWDRNPFLLGTPGGTVDLTSGELRDADRQGGITRVTSVAPLQDGCPLWLRFLSETTGDDAELIRFLQQWCGYGLTGSTREHALVFVYGPGGNGKSVFLNVVTSVLADYATTAAMDTFTASNNDKHPTDLAMLRGARLVTASETEENRAWAEARIKQMTGGDRISARFMRQDFFQFTPQFKLTIVGNHKPVLKNVDEAARRRFLVVPFERKPVAPDRELERKLVAEAGGILQWMIHGCLDWQRHGLLRPASVLAATEEYFSDQDLFAHWLAEECDCEPGNMDKSESSSTLFGSWKEFAVSAGNSPGSQQTFKDRMTRHGFKFYRSARAREFFGVALSPKNSFHCAAE